MAVDDPIGSGPEDGPKTPRSAEANQSTDGPFSTQIKPKKISKKDKQKDRATKTMGVRQRALFLLSAAAAPAVAFVVPGAATHSRDDGLASSSSALQMAADSLTPQQQWDLFCKLSKLEPGDVTKLKNSGMDSMEEIKLFGFDPSPQDLKDLGVNLAKSRRIVTISRFLAAGRELAEGMEITEIAEALITPTTPTAKASDKTRDSLKSDGFAGGTADAFLLARGKLFPEAGEDAPAAVKDSSNKRAKTPEEILRQEVFAAPTIEAREESELFGRAAAKESVISYLQGCTNRSKDYISMKKFCMLGVSGVKGIGKTELLSQINERWTKAALGPKARTLFLSYNGGGRAKGYCTDPELMRKYSHDGGDGVLDSVGHLLLVSCGVSEEAAVQIPFLNALEHAFSKMDCGSTLVICIDEVIELDKQNKKKKNIASDKEEAEPSLAQKVMSACMGVQDVMSGKVVFIFTAILDSMFNEMTTLSGREVKPLPLNMIPLSNVFGNLLSRQLSQLAATHPSVHQLVLSCAGHPRATVDGLGEAIAVSEIAQGTSASLVAARTKIIAKCKLNWKDLDEDILSNWFRLNPISNQLREELLAKGILHSLGEGGKKVEFLFPLLVQHWATCEENVGSAFAFHLKGLFEADLVLGPSSEKEMEHVMCHFEAVVRKAMNGVTFDVRDFYKSKHIQTNFTFSQVHATVPAGQRLTYEVKDFSNIDHVIELLMHGYIVVSNNPIETGVEYLSPFVRSCNGNLVVACVQCKFVQDQTKWNAMKKKMEVATEHLKARNISCFPVVYTTADQNTMKSSTYSDGIYFVERDIFELTKKVGLLRLHTMKLGKNLEKDYPFLKN